MRRTLEASARQLAALTALAGSPAAWATPPGSEWQATLAAAYQPLFAPAAPPPLSADRAGGAAFRRWQVASERCAAIGMAIAHDAAGRLVRSLAADADDAGPVTTLRALHALWVDCGEAAWAEAANRDDFGEAQAELLMALAGLAPAASRR